MTKNYLWVAPCGIDCSKCSIHNRTNDELEYWKDHNVDPDTIRCNGCRSDRKDQHWSPDCKILECCVYQKKYEFCSKCNDFPCITINEWIDNLDHHKNAIDKMKEMKKVGKDHYFSEIR